MASALAVIISNEQRKWSTSRRCKNSITTLTYQLVNWSLSIYFRERPTSHHFIHSMSEVKCWSDRMLKYAIGHCVRRYAKRFFFHWGLLWQSNNGLSSDIGTHLLRFLTCDLARPWGRRTQTCLLMLTKGYLCVSMSSTDNVQKKNRWHVPLLYLYKSSDLTPRLYWNDPRDCETSKIRLFTDLHIPM